jgi:hypothetical protein
MNAQVGDWVVVESVHLGGARRIGQVTEVRHADGTPPYVVRWIDDDRETLFFPGAGDAHRDSGGHARPRHDTLNRQRRAAPATGPNGPVRRPPFARGLR